MKSAKILGELQKGVDMYYAVKKQKLIDRDEYNGFATETTIVKDSKIFRDSCQRLVELLYDKGYYKLVIQYGNYLAEIPEAGTAQDGELYLYTRLTFFNENEEIDTTPVIICAIYMFKAYYKLGNTAEAIRIAKMVANVGGITAMEFLGDYYSNFNTEEGILLSNHYYSMINNVDESDEELKRKIQTAKRKALALHSGEVNQVLLGFSQNWLEMPRSNNETWETYSGLQNNILKQLPRENSNVIQVDMGRDYFKDCGYVPGQIDLKKLWKVYQDAHTIKVKKNLLISKKEYNGKILVGDFVDCCRFLWMNKYKS